MQTEKDIWDQRGTLSSSRDESDGVELPPIPDEVGTPRPLREILGAFVGATTAQRERYSLIMENGQAFSADDICEMLQRADSPFTEL